ncbi:uncharacterized protein LOC128983099 [Macrosteles quadrilineatus]|uniref:uncharacterized protein LOC128983099 n=1 Tax=Macrosteles quadrilineatus TaxID=74068 RepID=UPI0023E20B51|nr:uncharacterized protein LOC128983099 [Macrosteles quadrilineatus]
MRTVWSKKNVILGCIVGFILWLMLRKQQYRAKFDALVRNSKPIEVWEYVADFSNMKRLNPTILDFTIEEESGNYDHWKYTVHYTEFLSNLPFMSNYAEANYQVKPLSEGTYIIQSTHTTCFYSSLACVNSVSSFTFEPKAESTLCTEDVIYECPTIFSKFCEREVWFQRHAIMENLQKHFK